MTILRSLRDLARDVALCIDIWFRHPKCFACLERVHWAHLEEHITTQHTEYEPMLRWRP